MLERCLICIPVSNIPPHHCLVVALCHVISILTRTFSLLAVFLNAKKFTSDVSKWDVAKVSNMQSSKYSFLPPLSRRRLQQLSYSLTDARKDGYSLTTATSLKCFNMQTSLTAMSVIGTWLTSRV